VRIFTSNGGGGGVFVTTLLNGLSICHYFNTASADSADDIRPRSFTHHGGTIPRAQPNSRGLLLRLHLL
jgi:hypothetical protein